MSIPTCSFCASPSYSYSSEVRRSHPANKNAWASEISGRILQYGDTVEQFIDTLLPCSTPFALNDNLGNPFANYRPGKGREKLEYGNVVAGFTSIIKSFPPDKKLEIADTHGVRLYFPFDAFISHHHYTEPDISVSLPGKRLAASWQNVSMVIETKGTDAEDPFPRRGHTNVATVEQLAKNARNLMLAHGALSAFVIGVYGHTVRLARFDHSCALVSKPLDIDAIKNHRLIQKFFWHFTHPLVGGPVVGRDPTVMKLDAESQEWVKKELQRARAKRWQEHVAEIAKGRRVEIYDEKTGRCIPYLLYHLVDVNGRLFSRATMVWRAIEDTRIWKDRRLVPDPSRTTPVKPRIMKEAWRQLVRTAEAKFYQRLEAKIPQEEKYGLASMVYGGDLGEFELRWWKEKRRRREAGTLGNTEDPPTPGPSSPATSSSSLFCSTGSATSPLVATLESPEDYVPRADFPLPYPQHQTYSWRLVFGKDDWHRERSHMRMIIDDVGRPLTEFTSTHELVCAVRDAIRGHRQAWTKARLLHRDISVGNILISDEQVKDFVGFLHDYDYSSMEPDPDEKTKKGRSSSGSPKDGDDDEDDSDDGSDKKERTGTFYFMAYEILKVPGVIHNAHHDLESFYWVFLWVIVRHTDHGDKRGRKLCNEIFVFGDDAQSAHAKRGWLSDYKFEIQGNKPLTHLLSELKDLLLDSLPTTSKKNKRILLTYEALLEVFDAAIDMPGWPQDDWRECTLLKGDGRTGIAPIAQVVEEERAGIMTAPAEVPGKQLRKLVARRMQGGKKVRFPPLPDHPDLPPPYTTHEQVERTRSKKRAFPSIAEEDADVRGTMSESAPTTRSKNKRVKPNNMGPPTRGPVTRSQSRKANAS